MKRPTTKNYNKYSLSIGEISLSVESQKSLVTLRRMVLNDATSIAAEWAKMKAIAEIYNEDDDEPEDSEIEHRNKKLKAELNFMYQ